MKRVLALLTALFMLVPAVAQQRQVAITIEDLPPMATAADSCR